MDVTEVLNISVLLIPFLVTLLTQLAKSLPFIPVTSRNAKWFALGVSLIYVAMRFYSERDLSQAGALLYAGEAIATYGLSVGFYETFKKYFKSFEDWVKSI